MPFDALPRDVLRLCAAAAGVDARMARAFPRPLRDAVPVQRVGLCALGDPDDPDALAHGWAARWSPDVVLEVPQYCSLSLAKAAARCLPPGGTVRVGTGVWDPPEPPAEIAARSTAVAAVVPAGCVVRVVAAAGMLPPHFAALCTPFRRAGHTLHVEEAMHIEEARDSTTGTGGWGSAALLTATRGVLVGLDVANVTDAAVVDVLTRPDNVPALRSLSVDLTRVWRNDWSALCPVVARLDRLALIANGKQVAALACSFGGLSALSLVHDDVVALPPFRASVVLPDAVAQCDAARLRNLSVLVKHADVAAGWNERIFQGAARAWLDCRVEVLDPHHNRVTARVRGDRVEVHTRVDRVEGVWVTHPWDPLVAAFAAPFQDVVLSGPGAVTALCAIRRNRIEHAATSVPLRSVELSGAEVTSRSPLFDDGWLRGVAFSASVVVRDLAVLCAVGGAVFRWTAPCTVRVRVPEGLAAELAARDLTVRDLPGGMHEIVLCSPASSGDRARDRDDDDDCFAPE